MLFPCILHLLIQFILPISDLYTILGESVIVFRRLRIHFNNIVSLLHCIVQSSPEFDCLLLRTACPKIPLLTGRL